MIKESKNKIIIDSENKEYNYTCPVCGKSNLKTSKEFDRHMLNEHGRSYPMNNIKGGSV